MNLSGTVLASHLPLFSFREKKEKKEVKAKKEKKEVKEKKDGKEKKGPSVPESLLKKRKRYAAIKTARVKALRVEKKVRTNKVVCDINTYLSSDLTGFLFVSLQNRRTTRNLIFARAQFYHKEYRQMYRREIRMNRMARKVGNFYVPAEPKLAFVIRIRG